jgi:solute carrier family 38 (sodium-coupled neutral amino acid transporter), member 11
VFTAFFISPTSECLGPILELNVIFNFFLYYSIYFKFKKKILPFFPFFSKTFIKGLLSAIPLSYIIPGLIFLKLDPHTLFSREKLPAIALVVFGLVVSISGENLVHI